jgi:hypothetical protein
MRVGASLERECPLLEIGYHTGSSSDSLFGLSSQQFTRAPKLRGYENKQLDGPRLSRQSTRRSSGYFLKNEIALFQCDQFEDVSFIIVSVKESVDHFCPL